MSSESLEIAEKEYNAGKAAFERGDYRQSIQHLEKASALLGNYSRLGGEVQTWLVTAYEADGQRQAAIDLCRRLGQHPDLQTRQQSRRILYILEAPRLNMRPEWLTQIPDMATLDQNESKIQQISAAVPKRAPRSRPTAEPEFEDLSQINTQDNRFIWLAIAGIIVFLGGVIWLS